MCVSTGNQMLDLVIVGAAVVMTGGFAAAPLAAGAAASAGAAAGGVAIAGSTFTAASVAAGLATTVSVAGTLSALNQSSLGDQYDQLPPQAAAGPAEITGSGGADAPKVLAQKIKDINRTSQQDTSAPAGTNVQATGLQLS
jgi:hypothetical protein